MNKFSWSNTASSYIMTRLDSETWLEDLVKPESRRVKPDKNKRFTSHRLAKARVNRVLTRIKPESPSLLSSQRVKNRVRFDWISSLQVKGDESRFGLRPSLRVKSSSRVYRLDSVAYIRVESSHDVCLQIANYMIDWTHNYYLKYDDLVK